MTLTGGVAARAPWLVSPNSCAIAPSARNKHRRSRRHSNVAIARDQQHRAALRADVAAPPMTREARCDSLAAMATLEDIEKAVTELPAEQLAKFRAWFEEFEAAHFDQ